MTGANTRGLSVLKKCLLRESWLYSKCISNSLEKKTIAQSNSWKDSERKKSCQMLIAHFWIVKLKNNNKTNTIMKLLHIHHFYIARKTSCLPPKNFASVNCLQFLLWWLLTPRKNWKQFSCKFYGRCKNYGE